ncbi:polysaccharide deacetylase family protein [Ammoniphilus sp. YIM 78166]|uniref:polysaccharide deacetylase family protein n=1 Tax=Ammoniphilus sp. YIM 78166 TaxID=1644106 RepID=UPI00106F5FA2|nr:polysaccharide deacetylase family protein [Ammoniphilus sp. YIM 78166]
MIKARTLSLLVWILCLSLLSSCSTQSSAPPVEQPALPQPADPAPTPQEDPPEAQEPPAAIEPPANFSSYYVDMKNYRIHSAEEGEKIALLTFDDGPKGVVTLQILDILDKYGAKSIWFVNGFNYGWDYKPNPQKEEQFITLIKEIHARGHIVANHTWEHQNLRKLTPEKQRQEILSMNTLLESITGEKPKYFRPPFGAYTDAQKQVMRDEGMQWMNWSVGSLDWELKEPQQVVQQVVSTMHNGANILLHDFPITAEALDPLLKELSDQGYKFVLPTEVKQE